MVSGRNIQDLDLSKSIISKRRNPVLADVFARLGYMERQGSGIKKIIENYETEANYSEDLKPEFFSDSSQFSVILKNLNYGKSIEKLTIASEKLAIEPQKVAIEDVVNSMKANKNTKSKALMLFREFGYEGIFGRQDVASLTGESQTAAGGLITKLKESGIISMIEGYSKRKYRFSENQVYQQSKQD